MPYDEIKHRHRFAAWCASTAARSSPKCRFSVSEGVNIIEGSGLSKMAMGWDALPQSNEFDKWHRSTRTKVVDATSDVLGRDRAKAFTHGVAAKLINCYLKPLFLTSVHPDLSLQNKIKMDAIHPPIDRVLMDGLLRSTDERIIEYKPVWKTVNGKGWSGLNSNEYESVIVAIRKITSGELWKVEQYWQGYQ